MCIRDRKVIGECDRPSAPLLIHEDAIYIHRGQQYQVEYLDWDDKKAFVTPVAVITTPTPSLRWSSRCWTASRKTPRPREPTRWGRLQSPSLPPSSRR